MDYPHLSFYLLIASLVFTFINSLIERNKSTITENRTNFFRKNILNILSIVGLILGLYTGYESLTDQVRTNTEKAKKDSLAQVDALIKEQKRADEYKSIIGKNDTILTRADSSLKGLVTINKQQKQALFNLRQQLVKTENVLKNQNLLSERQSLTLKNITGSDSLPRLEIRLEHIRLSPTEYDLVFYIHNEDIFSIYGLELEIEAQPAKRHPIPVGFPERGTGSRITTNDYMLKNASKNFLYKTNNPITVKQLSVKEIFRSRRKFDYMLDETIYNIKTSWLRGSYTFMGTIRIDDFRPHLKSNYIDKDGKEFYSRVPKCCFFTSNIDSIAYKEIKYNERVENGEKRIIEDLKKRDAQHKQ